MGTRVIEEVAFVDNLCWPMIIGGKALNRLLKELGADRLFRSEAGLYPVDKVNVVQSSWDDVFASSLEGSEGCKAPPHDHRC